MKFGFIELSDDYYVYTIFVLCCFLVRKREKKTTEIVYFGPEMAVTLPKNKINKCNLNFYVHTYPHTRYIQIHACEACSLSFRG